MHWEIFQVSKKQKLNNYHFINAKQHQIIFTPILHEKVFNIRITVVLSWWWVFGVNLSLQGLDDLSVRVLEKWEDWRIKASELLRFISRLNFKAAEGPGSTSLPEMEWTWRLGRKLSLPPVSSDFAWKMRHYGWEETQDRWTWHLVSLNVKNGRKSWWQK